MIKDAFSKYKTWDIISKHLTLMENDTESWEKIKSIKGFSRLCESIDRIVDEKGVGGAIESSIYSGYKFTPYMFFMSVLLNKLWGNNSRTSYEKCQLSVWAEQYISWEQITLVEMLSVHMSRIFIGTGIQCDYWGAWGMIEDDIINEINAIYTKKELEEIRFNLVDPFYETVIPDFANTIGFKIGKRVAEELYKLKDSQNISWELLFLASSHAEDLVEDLSVLKDYMLGKPKMLPNGQYQHKSYDQIVYSMLLVISYFNSDLEKSRDFFRSKLNSEFKECLNGLIDEIVSKHKKILGYLYYNKEKFGSLSYSELLDIIAVEEILDVPEPEFKTLVKVQKNGPFILPDDFFKSAFDEIKDNYIQQLKYDFTTEGPAKFMELVNYIATLGYIENVPEVKQLFTYRMTGHGKPEGELGKIKWHKPKNNRGYELIYLISSSFESKDKYARMMDFFEGPDFPELNKCRSCANSANTPFRRQLHKLYPNVFKLKSNEIE